ncbi:hypothetical protein F5B20DRAFT_103439 [Whalleya microplaca]|nr:hypothetical protein F5B20DRAFT_103439 [Whalleya microplaca]
MTTTAPTNRAPSPSPSQVPLPASPVYSYASTANQLSSYSLPLPPPPRPAHTILTKLDLENSQQAYSDLLATAKSYRLALASLSTAASAFGSALEACARLKESRADALGPGPGGTALNMTNSFTMPAGSCTADLLMSASGVHQLIANHQQILSETVYRSFEVPLLHEVDKWRRDMEDAEAAYAHEVGFRSREIRRLEKEGLKLHKQRRRDVAKFREHLVDLTGKLDGLTTLHADHARNMLRESQDTSEKILDASCSLVRAEVDIFEGLARKGWSGGGLDELLEKGRDLFASEEDAVGTVAAVVGAGGAGSADGGGGGGAKLFSILPPKSILADSASEASGQRPHGRADSLLVEDDRYQSLAGAVDSRDREADRAGADTESIFSEFNQQQQGRGVRPFSPQPVRRHPTDVIMDPESLLHGDTDNDDDEDDDDDEDTVQGARQGLGLDEDEVDEETVSPWKDEGLRLRKASESAPATALPKSIDGTSTPTERELRWSVAADETGR